MQDERSFFFFIGTYTQDNSDGIYKCVLHSDGSFGEVQLVAKSENPSFLCKSQNDQYLLAVNETARNNKGAVQSFAVSADLSLNLINSTSSGGADPCHIASNNEGYLLASNYSSGSVALLQTNKNGFISDLLDLKQHIGSDITERQKEAHAHSSWFVPDSNVIISLDLGSNELIFSRIDKEQNKLVPVLPIKLKMHSGAGPRHLAFHPNKKWIYILNELNSTVTIIFRNADAEYKIGDSVSSLPEDFDEANLCAEIKISADGKFLYLSNRGHDTIAIFSIKSTDGSLQIISHQKTFGKEPRNFALSPNDKFLIVANQETNNIASFKRDPATGLLTYIGVVKAPTPVCILFR